MCYRGINRWRQQTNDLYYVLYISWFYIIFEDLPYCICEAFKPSESQWLKVCSVQKKKKKKRKEKKLRKLQRNSSESFWKILIKNEIIKGNAQTKIGVETNLTDECFTVSSFHKSKGFPLRLFVDSRMPDPRRRVVSVAGDNHM